MTVTPRVYLIAGTQIYPEAMHQYLTDLDTEGRAVRWFDRTFPEYMETGNMAWVGEHAEILTEFAGRLCYASWEPGINPNVTRIRTDQQAYLRNLISSEHGSVLEHSSMTFLFADVSRVLTHELVRHRVGVAISQESMRYVRLTGLDLWLPEVFDEDDIEGIRAVLNVQEEWISATSLKYNLDSPEVDFAKKKRITSALRRVVAMGIPTDILWTANHRTIRHCLERRTSDQAEEEIRMPFQDVGRMARLAAPGLYSDYEVTPDGQWRTRYQKV